MSFFILAHHPSINHYIKKRDLKKNPIHNSCTYYGYAAMFTFVFGAGTSWAPGTLFEIYEILHLKFLYALEIGFVINLSGMVCKGATPIARTKPLFIILSKKSITVSRVGSVMKAQETAIQNNKFDSIFVNIDLYIF